MKPLDFFLQHQVAVFPISRGTKVPAVPKGTHWAAWDDFSRPRPAGAYGVVLGALIVVDTDTPDAETFVAASLPSTPFRVQTLRGWHRYYAAPASPTPATIHRAGLAIECRRHGQYVVGPGSLHKNGQFIYTAMPWSWDWNDLPVFPADFMFDDRVGQVGVGAAFEAYEPPDRICNGERHHELFRLIRHLKALGNDRATVRYAVGRYNKERCDEPLTEDGHFESWFGRAWSLTDRSGFGSFDVEPLPAAAAPATFDFDPPEVDRG
jgi:hypothetical protein